MSALIALLALLAALVTALVPPASYFLGQRAYEVGALEARARSLAAALTRQGWLLNAPGSEAYLRRILRGEAGGQQPEIQRLLWADGTVLIAEEPEVALPAPVLRRRALFVTEGDVLWQVEVVRSVRPAFLGAALLLAPCAGLGLLVFLLLRLLPFRALADALGRAAHLSTHDSLTGLMNRDAFQDRLLQAWQGTRREDEALAVLLIDLDRFKPVNDTFGHASGDALLIAVARRLSGALRAGDVLARLGGDEFAILQTGTRPEAAAALATRLLAQFATPFVLGSHQVEIGASIGIALGCPGEPAGPHDLVQQADLAMYQAKRSGHAGFRFFTPELNEQLRERHALERDLRRALQEGQFRLAYQPLVCLASGRVLGAEALLRWHRPGHGDIPPDRFIGLAEEIGLIGPLGAWVLQEACREAALWPAPIGVAVNVSPLQFLLPDLDGTVKAALQRAGLAPERLELEITEGILLRDTPDTLEALGRLRNLGVRLAMDDFGTGYSSLGYLSRFAFDKIKIDRSFVRHLADDPKAKAVVRAVMGISQTLGIRAHAEGVESSEQAELLRQEGCEEVQGYLYGRPMSPDQFATLCRRAA
ncbi:EAL domain-containing protein [Roseomonas sp. E05]|uniref:putative bifunctional diguanylate cyclase/phosphodiesterase n=1 Tax=Roseomonas sp. E05 TaxID=3046310 RepID=UPI0024BB907A|nr:EAL domain-containing protein [Roseomonas sp. E05]MDJ0388210.1 EAL domain-containing protein [Roseomonas sp. E05]